MDDPHLQEHFPLANPLPPKIENSHRVIHGSRYLMYSLRFLLSLSLLSLFISYLTGISFYYSYSYYFSTFFLPLATCVLERKYMFLISNGIILVFLVSFRGLHDHDHHVGEIILNKHLDDDYVIDVVKRPLETDALEDDHKQEKEAFSEGEKEEEGGHCDDSLMEEAHDAKEDEGRKDDEDGEMDKDVIGSSIEDDEELNKKFDEFIRKMKEELSFEAKEYHIVSD